jgi:4-hydroxy-tetrahydrodipicolinate reductase
MKNNRHNNPYGLLLEQVAINILSMQNYLYLCKIFNSLTLCVSITKKKDMKVAIIGYGKMGREIEKILTERGHSVELIIDVNNAADLTAENLAKVDVAIEFTIPSTAYGNIRKCLECGAAVVSGTTGWTDRLPELQELCKQKGGAMFYASNYSLGVNLMFRLNRELARMMNAISGYSISIEETHHTEKKDSPSGTAVTLADDIIERIDAKTDWVNEPTDKAELIGIESFRVGMTPGDHTVTYTSEDDVLEIRHSIKNRRTLALGAVVAAEFLCGKKGVYTMEDLF